jgi:D-beta-D-heptose 7-phosphate kinase / D-beta-D-heptose 1-phosphate adenosyltransferase
MNVSANTVLCIGDVMLDRFVYSDMERISPEAPVPVLRMRHTREMLGGAGNVASNIASLGGRAVLIGLLGRDGAGASVREAVAKQPRILPNLLTASERPTICKSRFIASNQQVMRFDEESSLPLTEAERGDLLAAVRAAIAASQAVVLSDYGKGLLTRETAGEIIAMARAAGQPVFVDPKSRDFSDYRGATCITPNLRELAAASAMDVSDDEGVVAAARKVLAQSQTVAILVTRSEKGMVLVEATGEVFAVPARAREVYDVSGAGDTVIAAMALLHAAGRPLSQAMHFANAAASVVVSKFGTAAADMAEVLQELSAQAAEPGGDQSAAELQTLERVRDRVNLWRGQGLSVGFTNGCFDVLHSGHVAMLSYARSECDRLIVGLNSDASVRRLKGAGRPVNPLHDRAAVLAGLRHVDGVVAFEDDTPIELIRALMPDVLVKGADYTIDAVVGADIVRASGGRVLLAELMPGRSSSNTIRHLQAMSLAG